MKSLLIATHNPAKIDELKKGLNFLTVEKIVLFTLNDVRVEEEPEETGTTFGENSIIKARYYGDKTALPVITDDGGLIIPYLNNEPGVRSRRWTGKDASDSELIAYTLKRLKNVRGDSRRAYLETCITFYNPATGRVLQESAQISGRIADKPSGRAIEGYPYRALFIVDKYKKYYDEMTEYEHNLVNHRFKAIKRLTNKIMGLL